MNYTMDLSYNINKHGNKIKEDVIALANKYYCKDYSCLYEFEGQKHINRSHCVISIVFSEELLNKMITFVKMIKRIKNLYIEVLYNENNKIIYTSKYYKKVNQVKDIKNSEREFNLLNELMLS